MKKLPVRIGQKDNSRTVDVNFLVMDIPMVYNVILGRPTLSAIKAVTALYLLLMQFELDDGRVGKLCFGDQRMTRECYYVSLKSLGRKDEASPAESSRPNKLGKTGVPEAAMILSASAKEHGRPRPEPTTDIDDVPLDNSCPACSVRINNALAPPIKDAIISLLQ